MLLTVLDDKGNLLRVDRSDAGPDDMLAAAWRGDVATVYRALKDGADVDMVDEATGLSLLHIAVGTGNLPFAQDLIDNWHARFFADAFGRWPSIVAAECGASEALCDFIAEKEAAFLAQQEG